MHMNCLYSLLNCLKYDQDTYQFKNNIKKKMPICISQSIAEPYYIIVKNGVIYIDIKLKATV